METSVETSTAPDLVADLVRQLDCAIRLASTRAEHLRLNQMRATAAALHAQLPASA